MSVLSNALWTSSIEQTALMLAAPFRAAATSNPVTPCPLDAASCEGHFGSEAIRGAARFELYKGIWLNSVPQRDAAELQIIAVSSGGGLNRAALVTPVGAYDLRAKNMGTFDAGIAGERVFSIAFR